MSDAMVVALSKTESPLSDCVAHSLFTAPTVLSATKSNFSLHDDSVTRGLRIVT